MTDVTESCFLTLLFIFLFVFVSADQKNITAESGQNVTLPCRAHNTIIIVEWSRADLGDEHVLLYREGFFDPDRQHDSFANRVDLQDRQRTDGDVSLILKNVKNNDTGKYECRVFTRGTNRRKRANLKTDPICIIQLSVVPPGPPGGAVGLTVGLSVSAVLLLVAAVVGFLIYRKRRQPQDSYQPPPDQP